MIEGRGCVISIEDKIRGREQGQSTVLRYDLSHSYSIGLILLMKLDAICALLERLILYKSRLIFYKTASYVIAALPHKCCVLRHRRLKPT